jgi:hypothetical protein
MRETHLVLHDQQPSSVSFQNVPSLAWMSRYLEPRFRLSLQVVSQTHRGIHRD